MSSPSTGAGPNYSRPLALLTVLFFMWGLLTSMNDILIPYLKKVFDLDYWQAMLVQMAFFGAYFLGSLLYFAISVAKGDPIARMGYQKGIVGGLLISGIGAFLFLPAARLVSYPFFLSALFILGLGFTLLQISANPFVAILGPERTASSRLNLSQGFNSLGTVFGPLIGGYLVFRYFAHEPGEGAGAVEIPYLSLAITLIVLAILFSRARLPRIGQSDRIEAGMTALRHPRLRWGILAIFMYVGAEVSIGSFLVGFFGRPEIAGFSEAQASPYVSIYWGGLMIGRFLGAISLSHLGRRAKLAATFLIPAIGFLFLAFNLSRSEGFGYGATLHLMLPYLGFLALVAAMFILGRSIPARTTFIFALVAVVLLLAVLGTDGRTAMWCVIAIGLVNSVMWSNVFTLSIEGLGRDTSQASSLLVMAIVGGAVFPFTQGLIADHYGVHASFWVPLGAYLYISWFALEGHALRAAGEEVEAS
ncbi:MAG: sugar MFS transporter [Planctomycetes bacterium]|nr:sugar MFS transporter [Planctomycetota bacterium]